MELRSGSLEAILVDNSDGLAGQDQKARRERLPAAAGTTQALMCTVPFEERFNGYNGVSQLRYAQSPTPFLPCAAGLNCEFFFDENERSYAPRWRELENFEAQTSRLERLSPSSTRLIIEPEAAWRVRVESVFKLVEPFFLDVEHSFIPTQAAVKRSFLGVFWASYIQVPKVPPFYFRGRQNSKEAARWMSIFDALDFAESGVIAPETTTSASPMGKGKHRLLYSVASKRYVNPFFCGKVGDMLLAFLFRSNSDLELRFAFNAQGGGPGVPAWDYQALAFSPQVGHRYTFNVRVIYKPFQTFQETLSIHDKWTRS